MLNLFPVNHPRADDLLLVLGKVTRLGMEFEGKCKGILHFIRLANALRDAPELSFEEIVASPVTVLAPPLPNLMGKDGDAGLSAPAWFVPPVNSNDPGGAATGAR